MADFNTAFQSFTARRHQSTLIDSGIRGLKAMNNNAPSGTRNNNRGHKPSVK